MSKHLRKVKRRDFLKLGTAIGGGLLLSTPLRPGSKWSARSIAHISRTNPALGRLGYKETDKVLIVQVDDVGMFEANMSAYTDLLKFGLITSCSALPACVWFPQVAHLARIHPKADVGLNLTLTSEWDAIRWRPISTVDPESGLMDGYGYFHKSVEELPKPLNVVTITQELEKQILRARNMGVRITHIDAHQGISYHPDLLEIFTTLSSKYELPLVFLRQSSPSWNSLPWLKPEWISPAKDKAGQMEAAGAILLDSITDLTQHTGDHIVRIKDTVANLPAGLHLVKVHAAKETPELKAITPDWKNQVKDYAAWMSIELLSALTTSNIKLIGWSVLLDR